MTHPTTPAIHSPDDAAIFAAARHALDQCPQVPGTVRVHLDHGIATLTGGVRSSRERVAAEDTVRNIPGVQGLVNKITVEPDDVLRRTS